MFACPWQAPQCMPHATMTTSTTTKKRHVCFGTATTYIFPLTYGGSAVPTGQGPPIGLAKTHMHQELMPLAEGTISSRRHIGKYDNAERMTLLRNAGFICKDVAEISLEAIDIRKSRLDTEDDVDVQDEHSPKRRKFNTR
ncbi:Aste57867_2819 [Aphanomyces stellatus]|uniref:Aste57867_2819 protein n=1 Tax=Aphanomyces stellatus TaxID=120398 RepID=A0A485KA13_9STRA|nr:hypothetical protein As57867_002812 [Aphanomyces stellatus]VFT80007.1 Aste57867_2819 [Aphanomyces stellatus]